MSTVPSKPFCIIWLGSALASAAALALTYGFREPVVADSALRIIFIAALALFALSRVVLIVPFCHVRAGLRRWWVDFVLIVAAIVWRATTPGDEPILLRISAIYILVMGVGTLLRSGAVALIDGLSDGTLAYGVRRLFVLALIAAVIGGGVLNLPVCWNKPFTGEKWEQHAKHGLDCLFVSAAALTGTGLSTLDVGNDFTPAGQVAIVVLMQIGGLAVLVLGATVGWRFRHVVGWGHPRDDVSRAGLRRLVVFVCVLAFILELGGSLALYNLWNEGVDANFAQQPDGVLFGSLEQGRVLASVFHAVSAFCNAGLTLPRDGLIAYDGQIPVYAVLLPLMVLGSVGGPVLYDWWRRVVSRDARVTMLGTLFIVLFGTVLLCGIESTRHWQFRYPREDTPGRLRLAETRAAEGVLVFSSEDTERAQAERLRGMPMGRQAVDALFQSASANTGGMQIVRLDESSLSPASRVVLMVWMFVGGGIGGTAGGVRIVFVYVLVSLVFVTPRGLKPAALWGAAAAIVAGMMLLIACTTLVLVYRDAGSFEACAFEAVSACCDVGLSTGMTPQLSIEGRCAVILAMLLGRVLPMGILLRFISQTRSATADPPVETPIAL